MSENITLYIKNGGFGFSEGAALILHENSNLISTLLSVDVTFLLPALDV